SAFRPRSYRTACPSRKTTSPHASFGASSSAWRSSSRRTSVGTSTELDVVDVLGDRGRVAADGAARVAPDGDLVERSRQRVVEQQAPDERLADLEDELERLRALDRADHAWQDAEHAALGATRCELRRRRLREEASVTRACSWRKDGRL